MNSKTQTQLLAWLPFCAWFALISFFSSLHGDEVNKLLAGLLNLLRLQAPLPAPSGFWSFWGHRIAHFLEYAVLGVLAVRAYLRDKPRVSIFALLGLAGLVFALAALDEWHQSFTPGRAAQLIDVIFDTFCGSIGIFVYKIWCSSRKMA